jgi:hypothetical protein
MRGFSRTGLTLVRVLRKGLWLGECLARLPGRANAQDETAFRTHVPHPGAERGTNAPTSRRPGSRALGRLHRQLRWIVALSSFPQS